ncbi:HD domain-containing protein [Enterococcus sp. LJL98]
MSVFEMIASDEEIKEIYRKIERYEDETGGWAYHNWQHVENVTAMTASILKQLGVSDDYLEAAKIAALLHDVGALEGKENHAFRGRIFSAAYFKKHDLHLPYEQEILSAIADHSNGFESDELLTLALILSDKLDITKSRVAKAGYETPGMRQLQFITAIQIEISAEVFCVDFVAKQEIDLQEFENFYFIQKVFRAIAAFACKIARRPVILLNHRPWVVVFDK